MSLLFTQYEGENFDAIIFQCLERALSTLGATQQEFVIFMLGKEYHITSKNLGKEAFGLEEILRRILGPSVSSFVIMHTLDYVATEFKIAHKYGSTLTQTVEVARRIYDEARPLSFRGNERRGNTNMPKSKLKYQAKKLSPEETKTLALKLKEEQN